MQYKVYVMLTNKVTKDIKIAYKISIYNHRTTKTNQKYPSVNL